MISKFAFLIVPLSVLAQGLQEGSHVEAPVEQSIFAMEGITISRPVDVPSSAVAILRQDPFVRSCVQEGQSADSIPSQWFVASEVHLRDIRTTDLIVQPRQLTESPAANACLYHAHALPFWVLAQTKNGYALLMKESTQRLEILDRRSNGYRNIETLMSTTLGRIRSIFVFDGHKYRVFKKFSLPAE
jgi:hypothetical protein